MTEERSSRPSSDATPPGATSLWLQLPERRSVWIASALVAAFYLLTMSRDLSFYDSAEFAIVACQGGLSHPPGHPLHALLGWLAAHLTWFWPLLGLNALSAIPAALAVVPASSLAWHLSGGEEEEDGPRWFRRRTVIPAVVAIVALHPALWETASRVEVYALAGVLALWSIARAATLLQGDSRPLQWLAPGIVFGLSASTNPVVATGAALALTPALVHGLARRKLRWTALGSLVGGGLLGLLPYAYIPFVAGREGVFVWGAPTGGDALWRFVTGADFAHNQGATLATIVSHAFQWLGWAAEHGLAPLLLLGLISHLLWAGRAGFGRALVLIGFGVALLLISGNLIFFPQVTDYLGYMMLPLSLMSAGAAALVTRVSGGGGRRPLLAVLLASALLLSVVSAPPWVFGRARHRDRVARVMSQGALESAPPDAVIIVASDHWVFPMIYLQEVERLRPDVVVLPRGLSGASWYWAHLQARHPRLNQFELRGRGGQPARIRRFLAANPNRAVLFEDWQQAASIGVRPACVGPWLLRDAGGCADGSVETRDDVLSTALMRQLDLVGNGSPTTDAVIANVALARGEMYWRLGQVDDALRALRAGVPAELRPTLRADTLTAPPLRDPLPAWRQNVAIGTPGRNLYLASLLLINAGEREDAQRHMIAAARVGLAEALSFAR